MSLLLSGKIQTLLDRLTATLATNLSTRVDTAISSRQSEANASSRYSTLNGKIDTVDGNVDTILARVPSTVASSSAVSAIPTSSIRSVQSGGVFSASPTGSASIYGATLGYYDKTITAVTDVNKCLVEVIGNYDPNGTLEDYNDASNCPVWAHLQNSTTLRIFWPLNNISGKVTAFYKVHEFY